MKLTDRWNMFIMRVNMELENPESGCDEIEPLEEATPCTILTKEMLQEVIDKLNEMPPPDGEESCFDIPDLEECEKITEEILTNIEDQLEAESWCNCEACIEPCANAGDDEVLIDITDNTTDMTSCEIIDGVSTPPDISAYLFLGFDYIDNIVIWMNTNLAIEKLECEIMEIEMIIEMLCMDIETLEAALLLDPGNMSIIDQIADLEDEKEDAEDFLEFLEDELEMVEDENEMAHDDSRTNIDDMIAEQDDLLSIHPGAGSGTPLFDLLPQLPPDPPMMGDPPPGPGEPPDDPTVYEVPVRTKNELPTCPFGPDPPLPTTISNIEEGCLPKVTIEMRTVYSASVDGLGCPCPMADDSGWVDTAQDGVFDPVDGQLVWLTPVVSIVYGTYCQADPSGGIGVQDDCDPPFACTIRGGSLIGVFSGSNTDSWRISITYPEEERRCTCDGFECDTDGMVPCPDDPG